MNSLERKERAIMALPLPYLIATAETMGLTIKPLDNGHFAVRDPLNEPLIAYEMTEATLRIMTAVQLVRVNRALVSD